MYTHDKLESLRARLNGLSEMLGGGGDAAEEVSVTVQLPAEVHAPYRPATAAAPRRHFQSASPAVLRSANAHARDTPLGGLLQKYRDAEAQWLKEKGRMALEVKAEAARRHKSEAELRRVKEQLAFRLGEVKHLKEALRGRDGQLTDLQDQLREYELAESGERTAAETVRQAEAERDELRGAMSELLQRLTAADQSLGRADESMGELEEQLGAEAERRMQAEQEAAAARAEADAMREEAAELRWKCSLLNQLSDLTLKQNDEKTATLRQLLESESMLDDEDAGAPQGSGFE